MSAQNLSGARPVWKPDLTRDEMRATFLESSPYRNWSIEALNADASFRRYFRLSEGSHRVLLMDSPPDTEDIDSYLLIDDYLISIGLRAPKVLLVDRLDGFAIIEDFGLLTYTRLLDQGVKAESLYALAVDVLKQVHRALPVESLRVPRYDEGFYEDEAALFVDWYWAARTGQRPSAEVRSGFLAIWQQLLSRVSTTHETLVLRDYHVDNLMVIDDTHIDVSTCNQLTVSDCGLLDFQDALIGSRAYDLVSLFEDARRDVDKAMTQTLLNQYMADFSEADRQQFLYDYRVLGAHRHAKVIGIFVRLCVRDKKGHYLNYLPHVQTLFEQALQHPVMAPLREWMERHHPGSVAAPLTFDVVSLQALLTE